MSDLTSIEKLKLEKFLKWEVDMYLILQIGLFKSFY